MSTGSPGAAGGAAECAGSALRALAKSADHDHASAKLSLTKCFTQRVKSGTSLARQLLIMAMCLPGSCIVALGP